MRVRFWRWAWETSVNRGLPLPIIEWVEEHYLAVMPRETIPSAAKVHERRQEIAGEWACLSGDGPPCSPGDGLHDETPWPSSL